MRKLPMLASDLIKQLDADEGPLKITPTTPDKVVYWRAARRELIDELLVRLDQQTFNPESLED